MPAVSSARRLAFQILLAVERGQAHSDDLLRGKAVDALPPADRNLATALVFGTLRWQIRLDNQLRPLLKRPNAKLDAEVRIALRLGAFQLLFLDRIPAHAVLAESVELAKQAGHRFASGMVNAVLRKLAGANLKQADSSVKGTGFSPYISPFQSTGALAPEEISPAEFALAYAHPAWIVERWANFYGLDAARAICQHGQSQPALSVRLQDPAAEAELIKAGVQLEPGALLACARTLVSGDVTTTDAFRAGRMRLQDEGSQLIADLAACGGKAPSQSTNSIADLCAAPGGKTLILAERNPQARIVACEASPQRLAQMRARLAAYQRIECRQADAVALKEEAVFDCVLADVPCSGTGTLGRNPEIRHRLQPDDLPRQAERQKAILRAALRAVRPGGFVVYSTCSLEPEENEQVIAAVLAATPAARQLSLELRIQALANADILTTTGAARLLARLTRSGALCLLPGPLPTDGFFAALLERTA